jgi:hypothetical protein
MNDIAEPVLIQTFIAKSSVKALNQIRSALACPAGLSATQHHAQRPIDPVHGK